MVFGVASLSHETYLDAKILSRCYRDRLQTLGLLTTGSRLNHRGIGERLSLALAPLADVPELGYLAGAPIDIAKQVTGVLSRPTRRCHPLRHVALLYALFDDWKSFAVAYQMSAANVGPPDRTKQGGQRASGPDRSLLNPMKETFRQFIAKGQSVRAAALAIGVDPSTGLAWATQAGIQVTRRPKRLKPSVRQSLVAQLRLGKDKATVASHAGVSIQSITRILRTEGGLRQAWNTAKHARAQNDARLQWSRSLRQHGGNGVIPVRLHAPAAYSWLYRHDIEWLQAHLPSSKRRTKARRSTLDWDARDRTLATTILSLQDSAALAAPRLWEIYLKVPELKSKLNRLSMLPRTRAAVEALIGRPWTRR